MRGGRGWLVAITAALMIGGCGGSPDRSENTVTNLEETTADQPGSVYCDVVSARTTSGECEDLGRQNAALYQGAAAIQARSPMTRGRTYQVVLLVDTRPARIVREIERQDAAGPQPTPTAPPVRARINRPSPSPTPDPTPSPTPVATPAPAPAADASPSPEMDMMEDVDTPGQILERLNGTTERFYPPIGRFMTAELVGDPETFEVTPRDKVVKQVPRNSQVRWMWKVRPLREGEHVLQVTTQVQGRVNGKMFVLADSGGERAITVEVTWPDWIKDQFAYFADWLTSLKGFLISLTAVVVAWFGLRAAIRKGRAGGNDASAS